MSKGELHCDAYTEHGNHLEREKDQVGLSKEKEDWERKIECSKLATVSRAGAQKGFENGKKQKKKEPG